MFYLRIPVLLIAFNRPDTTLTVFNTIKVAKPNKLYVSVDGPRKNNEDDTILIDKIKAIVKQVDWPCVTLYRFNEVNLGAEKNVSSAISWVLENEEYVIVLEDDIIAPLSFFRFAQEMLIKYKDEEKIGTVTGCNFTPINLSDNVDYFFAKYGHSWGWGTWKRVWKDFDLNVDITDEHLKLTFLKTITNSRKEARYYQRLFGNMKKRGPGNSSWDAIGLYYHRVNNRLSIIPRVNLTSNIGVYGVHAKGKSEYHFRPYDETFEAKNHPVKVIYNKEYDIHHFKTYIHKKWSFINRIISKIRKLYFENHE